MPNDQFKIFASIHVTPGYMVRALSTQGIDVFVSKENNGPTELEIETAP